VIEAQGPRHSLRYYWQTFAQTTWHPEVVAGSKTTYGGLSLVENVAGSIVAAQGRDDSLRFYWQYYGHAKWNAEHVAGPRTTFA